MIERVALVDEDDHATETADRLAVHRDGRLPSRDLRIHRGVADWRWVQLEALRVDMRRHPSRYTPWLHAALPRLGDFLSAG